MIKPRKYAVTLLQKGLTQKQIADEMGTYQSHINAWLNGQRVPSYNNLIKLSKVLNMPPELLSDELEKIANM
jgi:transcriptional regulator with XRE-family HTH domain